MIPSNLHPNSNLFDRRLEELNINDLIKESITLNLQEILSSILQPKPLFM